MICGITLHELNGDKAGANRRKTYQCANQLEFQRAKPCRSFARGTTYRPQKLWHLV